MIQDCNNQKSAFFWANKWTSYTFHTRIQVGWLIDVKTHFHHKQATLCHV